MRIRMALNPDPTPQTPRQMSWLREPSPSHEAPLLRDSQIAAWAGFRLGIFAAASIELAGQYGEHAAVGMILKGRTRARIHSRGEACDFSPGPDSVGLFAPHFEVDWTRWDCEPGAERMIVELDFSDIERAGDLDAMLTTRRALRQDLTLKDAHLASLLRLMADEVRQGSPHGALYATSLSLSLASYLFSGHGSGGQTRSRERGTLSSTQKALVLELVRHRLAQDLSLEDLAQAAGVSRFHFLRLFKNTFGVTPHRFVMDQRVDAARRMLAETKLPIAEVAASTGFSSQSHLNTAMRRSLGLTPGQWRRSS